MHVYCISYNIVLMLILCSRKVTMQFAVFFFIIIYKLFCYMYSHTMSKLIFLLYTLSSICLHLDITDYNRTNKDNETRDQITYAEENLLCLRV